MKIICNFTNLKAHIISLACENKLICILYVNLLLLNEWFRFYIATELGQFTSLRALCLFNFCLNPLRVGFNTLFLAEISKVL